MVALRLTSCQNNLKKDIGTVTLLASVVVELVGLATVLALGVVSD